MNSSSFTSLMQAALAAANDAAAYIRSRAAEASQLDWRVKRPADFVSDVDTGAESRIAAFLSVRYPGATVVGEELSPTAAHGTGITFIVDPLDGTTNFLHGYPQYAVSIGVVVEGVLSAGAVVDVVRGDAYSAALGAGAFRNGEPIRVSRIDQPALALIGTGFPFKHPTLVDEYLTQFARILRSTSGIRRAGAAALDLTDVACGRFDAFWELRLSPWDVAAGILIVREAGGRVTDLAGNDAQPVHGPIVASNGILHDWFLSMLV